MKTAACPLNNSTAGITTDHSDEEHPHGVCNDERKRVVGEHGAQSYDWGEGKAGLGEEKGQLLNKIQGQDGNT